MARKINLQLEDDVVMIAMTIITDDGAEIVYNGGFRVGG